MWRSYFWISGKAPNGSISGKVIGAPTSFSLVMYLGTCINCLEGQEEKGWMHSGVMTMYLPGPSHTVIGQH